MAFRMGIDVGGTNTDAVILNDDLEVVAKTKHHTTDDVMTGIVAVVADVLEQIGDDREKVAYAMLGTTQATNAIVERKRLNKVAAIRIGLPATESIAPMTGWPEELKAAIGDMAYLIHGGNEFDGREIAQLDEERIREICREVAGKATSVAITSVFSPVSTDHEERAAAIVREELGEDMPVSLSYEIGSIGLLERENATILNAALVDVARRTITSFKEALAAEGIDPRVYLGQNDGTLMNVDYALRYPILTIACGPTNSIRGAAYLAHQEDALVVDVGGTTTDVGVLVNGFPRQSSLAVEIGGVRTNFRMPDLISLGLGGGTIIRGIRGADAIVENASGIDMATATKDRGFTVGPDSVGYEITERARIFGGTDTTATDIVVALGHADLGDASAVADIDRTEADTVNARMIEMVEDLIDRMKTSAEPAPVILVGGGSLILPTDLEGGSIVVKPDHYEVANAIGSAIAQVSGEVERIYALEGTTRDAVVEEAKQLAIEDAKAAGADPDTIEIVDLEDVPLAYLPGNATRIRVKAAGNLQL